MTDKQVAKLKQGDRIELITGHHADVITVKLGHVIVRKENARINIRAYPDEIRMLISSAPCAA